VALSSDIHRDVISPTRRSIHSGFDSDANSEETVRLIFRRPLLETWAFKSGRGPRSTSQAYKRLFQTAHGRPSLRETSQPGPWPTNNDEPPRPFLSIYPSDSAVTLAAGALVEWIGDLNCTQATPFQWRHCDLSSCLRRHGFAIKYAHFHVRECSSASAAFAAGSARDSHDFDLLAARHQRFNEAAAARCLHTVSGLPLAAVFRQWPLSATLGLSGSEKDGDSRSASGDPLLLDTHNGKGLGRSFVEGDLFTGAVPPLPAPLGLNSNGEPAGQLRYRVLLFLNR